MFYTKIIDYVSEMGPIVSRDLELCFNAERTELKKAKRLDAMAQ